MGTTRHLDGAAVDIDGAVALSCISADGCRVGFRLAHNQLAGALRLPVDVKLAALSHMDAVFEFNCLAIHQDEVCRGAIVYRNPIADDQLVQVAGVPPVIVPFQMTIRHPDHVVLCLGFAYYLTILPFFSDVLSSRCITCINIVTKWYKR